MSDLVALLNAGRTVPSHRPFPRAIVDADTWLQASAMLAAGKLTLLSVWGDAGQVHMALLDSDDIGIAVLTLPCPDGRYPSVGEVHAPAIRLERAIRDLFGYEPAGLPDPRGWLDHADGTNYPF